MTLIYFINQLLLIVIFNLIKHQLLEGLLSFLEFSIFKSIIFHHLLPSLKTLKFAMDHDVIIYIYIFFFLFLKYLTVKYVSCYPLELYS